MKYFLTTVLKTFFFLLGFCFFFLISRIFNHKAFAQSQPVSCGAGYSGWQGDVALRETSWHHRGTLINTETNVTVGFLSPSGTWTKPDLISYGDGTGWSDPGSMWPYHTWRNPGGYLISIKYGSCQFNRKVWVAESKIIVSPDCIARESKNCSYQNLNGKYVCGVTADYTQAASLGTVQFKMPPVDYNYNLYAGQPGGSDGLAPLKTSLVAPNVNTTSNYSVNFYQADKISNTVSWQVIPSTVGASGSWSIKNIKVYLNCGLNVIPTIPPVTPTLRPSPIPTNIPTVIPTQRPTPTPEIGCSLVGSSVLDQSGGDTYTPQLLNSNWGMGVSPSFNPNRKSRLDKVDFYISGNGSMQLKAIDSSGAVITDQPVKSINSAGRWETFDFSTEPLVKTGQTYTILFRAVSGKIYVHRGNYWNWARRIYIKPCLN